MLNHAACIAKAKHLEEMAESHPQSRAAYLDIAKGWRHLAVLAARQEKDKPRKQPATDRSDH
jgi:hypothetical protein